MRIVDGDAMLSRRNNCLAHCAGVLAPTKSRASLPRRSGLCPRLCRQGRRWVLQMFCRDT
ncbi:hypothetical protein PCLA_07f0003 [Pseudomonas citronellolis]|nr:hypothetical protein PCLA_07f0003 [Pseudomonas citronellolis]